MFPEKKGLGDVQGNARLSVLNTVMCVDSVE